MSSRLFRKPYNHYPDNAAIPGVLFLPILIPEAVRPTKRTLKVPIRVLRSRLNMLRKLLEAPVYAKQELRRAEKFVAVCTDMEKLTHQPLTFKPD